VRKVQKTVTELPFVVPTSLRPQRCRLFQSPCPSSFNQNVPFSHQFDAALTLKGVKGRLRRVVEFKSAEHLLPKEISDDSPLGGVEE
jgi:hypothetical protein